MPVVIAFQTATSRRVLGADEEDSIKKGLRLLQLVGNEDERNSSALLLLELGEKIQQRPN